MKVIGFQFGSTTSPDTKQYTVLVADNGMMLKHYGGRGRGKTLIWAGLVTVNPLKDVTALYETLEAEYKIRYSKTGTAGYNTLTMSFNPIDIPLSDVTTSMKNSEAAQLVMKWLAALSKANQASIAVRKSMFPNELSHDRAAIHSFSLLLADKNAISTPLAAENMAKPKVKYTAKGCDATQNKENYFTHLDEPRVIRPNGEIYRPREIMGHTDVSLLRELAKNGIFVRLAGAPGAGKTALAEAAFPNLITVNGHGDMTVANFVGTYLPEGSEWKWHDGPLARAMREGKPLLVDEGTRIPTEVMNILFSCMDGRNMLRLDDRPDIPVIKGAPGFYVIMGYNPDTIGARVLDEALISRFRIQINVDTDLDTAIALGVPTTATRIAANLQTKNLEDRKLGGPGVWVPQMRELLTYRDLINMKAGENFALATLVASCPRDIDIPTIVDVIKKITNIPVEVPKLGGLV